ncbi:MAG: hypothetical protein NZ520_08780 [bacterium]|nr:hypothetical protein [bacterium]
MNPRAGGGRAGRIDWHRLCACIEAPFRVVVSSSGEEALLHAERFCQSGGDVLVVVGGDGSVHSVLPALVNTSTALALLPMGTSNVLARELGYPLGRRALSGCLQALRGGVVQQMDVGVVNGRPFTLMASTGFDAHVLLRVSEPLKRRWGVYAFLWTAWQELGRYQPTRYRVTANGQEQEIEAVLLIAANTAHYGWFTVVAPFAQIDDGELDLVWFPAEGAWRQRMWRVAWDVLWGRAGQCPYLRHVRARRVDVKADVPQPLQCDGEPAGGTPVRVDILPRALRVIVASPPVPSRSAA